MILGIFCKFNEKEGYRGRVIVFFFNFEFNNGFVKERISESMVVDGL